MAVTLTSSQILRVTIVTQLGDQVALNRLHYLVGVVTGTPTDQRFVNDFDNAINGSVKSLLVNFATYRGCIARIIYPTIPSFASVFSTTGAGAGTGTGAPAPRQARGIIRWVTGFSKRGENPRIYLPFPAASFCDNGGQPNAGYLSFLSAFSTAVLSFTTVGSGGNVAAVSPCTILTSPAIAFNHQIIDSVPHDKWATQRRSGDYGKPNVPPI